MVILLPRAIFICHQVFRAGDEISKRVHLVHLIPVCTMPRLAEHAQAVMDTRVRDHTVLVIQQ